jgi:hypothetical protein
MNFFALVLVLLMSCLTMSFMPAPGSTILLILDGMPPNGGISANIHGCPNCQGSINVQAPIRGGGHINGGITVGNGGIVSGGIGITIPF